MTACPSRLGHVKQMQTQMHCTLARVEQGYMVWRSGMFSCSAAYSVTVQHVQLQCSMFSQHSLGIMSQAAVSENDLSIWQIQNQI